MYVRTRTRMIFHSFISNIVRLLLHRSRAEQRESSFVIHPFGADSPSINHSSCVFVHGSCMMVSTVSSRLSIHACMACISPPSPSQRSVCSPKKTGVRSNIVETNKSRFVCMLACLKKIPIARCKNARFLIGDIYLYPFRPRWHYHLSSLSFKRVVSFPIQTNMTFLPLNSNISNPARGLGSFASLDWKDPCTPKFARNVDGSMLVLLFDVLLRRDDYQRCRSGTSHDIAPF